MGTSNTEVERDREAWRVRARAAFKARGHGSKVECARDIGCSPSEVSHLLTGRIKFAHWVVPISQWLGIAPPTIGLSDTVAELANRAEQLTPEQQQLLLNMANEMYKGRLGKRRP